MYIIVYVFWECYIAPVKVLFIQKVLIFFVFLHKNIHCGYSFRVPSMYIFWGGEIIFSTKIWCGYSLYTLGKALGKGTHSICFYGEIRKTYTPGKKFGAPRKKLALVSWMYMNNKYHYWYKQEWFSKRELWPVIGGAVNSLHLARIAISESPMLDSRDEALVSCHLGLRQLYMVLKVLTCYNKCHLYMLTSTLGQYLQELSYLNFQVTDFCAAPPSIRKISVLFYCFLLPSIFSI